MSCEQYDGKFAKIYIYVYIIKLVHKIDNKSQWKSRVERAMCMCVWRTPRINTLETFFSSVVLFCLLSQCEYRPPLRYSSSWIRGAYQCICKPGYYSTRHPDGFNGTKMEVAYQEYRDNISTYYEDVFLCIKCADGCTSCTSSAPCLASYNWVFRLSLLTISVLCAVFTIALACYLYHHRKVKVFKVASPIFLTITLLGCAIMYLEVCWPAHFLPLHLTI